ncbi:MAG: hypothetical protein JJE55_08235 [Flavobacteriaceae bacterium]|nr:hypothetical protein [Flavobacteriaceae bacterium]
MSKSALIERYDHGTKQTLGRLFVHDNGQTLYNCHTLELPWKNNDFQVSCIPPGTYKVVKRFSTKFKNHFHLTDVSGRSFILIHSGNYYTDILGCILVGKGLADINKDGLKDVTQSRDALTDLLALMPKVFELKIVKC